MLNVLPGPRARQVLGLHIDPLHIDRDDGACRGYQPRLPAAGNLRHAVEQDLQLGRHAPHGALRNPRQSRDDVTGRVSDPSSRKSPRLIIVLYDIEVYCIVLYIRT